MSSRVKTTPWVGQRDEWIASRTDADINALLGQILKDARTDENREDRMETDDAIDWLSSRGRKGREWGIVGRAAARLGMFEPTSPPLGPDAHPAELRLEALEAAGAALLAAWADEESEHGFPFSFALREAHAAFAALFPTEGTQDAD